MSTAARRRPAAVRAMVLMCAVSCVLAALGAAFPMSPQAPRGLSGVAACLAGLLGALVWWRQRWAWLHVAVALHVVGISALVATAATDVGAAAGSFGYVWVALYVAFFSTPVAARACSALVAAGLGAALLVDPFPGSLQVWVLVSATTVLAVEVVSRVVQRLGHAALVDPLTGTWNRSGLSRAAEPLLAHAGRTGEPLTVAVLDLDGFKDVNDRLGHAAGDALLVDVARCWRRELRSADELARYGGDEFVVLLPGTPQAQAEQLLGRLRSGSPVAVSAGLAQAGPGDTLDDLLLRADQRLYQVKRARPVDPAQRRQTPASRRRGPATPKGDRAADVTTR